MPIDNEQSTPADASQRMLDRLEERDRLREEEEKERLAQEKAAAEAKEAEEKAKVSTLAGKAQANLDAMREAKNNMDPSQFGLNEVGLEVIDAIRGGTAKTWSSIATFPERVIDMSTGAMEREMKETGKYEPSFDPLSLSDYDPNLKTWWGKLIEMGTHFTGLAGGVKSIPGVGAKVAGGGVAADLAVGFTSDMLSSTSQDGNLSQDIYESKIVERVPFMGEFLNEAIIGKLATKESDHPWLKTFKNALEGITADILVGTVLRKFEGGEKLDADRKDDIDSQVAETAREELDKTVEREAVLKTEIEQGEVKLKEVEETAKGLEDGPSKESAVREAETLKAELDKKKEQLEKGQFSAYTNRDLADPHQGAPNSRAKSTLDLAEQAKRVNDQWTVPGAGSTDAILTPAQATRMSQESGILEAELDGMAKVLLTDTRYQKMLAKAKSLNMTFKEVYGYAFERMQETMGRHATAVDAEDFWKPFFDDPQNIYEGLEAWASKNVVAADLVNASLFSQLRDLGIASREVFDIADIMDTDGPMKVIAERLIIGLTNVKRSRYLLSSEFRKLQGPQAKAALDERVKTLRAESEASVNMFMQMAQKSDSDAVAKALAEAFSMSNKIQNWKDLDAYMRKRLRNLGLTEKPGIVVRELQTVMMHSILSGPKTALRAMSGTFTAALLRPMNTVMGAAMRRDWDTMHANMASINAFYQTIPEAFQLFRTNLGSYWAGDVASVKTRFTEARTKADDEWELYGHWVERNGTVGDNVAYSIADTARKLNDSKFLTYSTSIMGATDDAFTLIMARARAREKALRLAREKHKSGDITEITPEMLRTYEDNFYKDLLDTEGNINIESDLYVKSAVKEATLTQDLSGLGASLDRMFNVMPFTKPFFLFARTGINGLMLSYKTMPGIGLLHKQSIDILSAKPDNLEAVAKYGITSAEDLANAKALIGGRQAIGGAVTTMAALHYMNGGLTGNGPQDRRLRKLWMDTGWQPRSIKIGNVWIGYDTFEPFNLMLAAIADIGDNMKLMGPQWAEQNFATVALAVAGTATSKSYLSGIGQFVDLFSGKTKQGEKIIANLANNTVPLAGLRNELGKVFSPYMREVNNSIGESLRNRNLSTEQGDWALPIKYDMLNGKPIRDWNFIERMWNAVSPINLQMVDSPGRNMLWNSNYDLRLVSYSSPDNVDLSDYPQMRSWFQEELGKLNMEAELDKLAERTDVKNSIKQMSKDANNGLRHLDPMAAYVHNRLIRDRFERARKQAWANVRKKHPAETEVLYEERAEKRKQTYQKLLETSGRLMPNI